MARSALRSAFRNRFIGILALAALSGPVVAPAEPTASDPSQDAVKMDAVEVKSDPFRTLGIHGYVAVRLLGQTQMVCEGVNPDSPSYQSGLRPGDEFVELAGKPIGLRTALSLRSMVKNAVDLGTSIPARVRPIRGTASHPVLLRAMVEPPHRWLPASRVEPEPSISPDPVPILHGDGIAEKSWSDRGSATPRAALESLFWHLSRGDVDAVAAAIAVSGSAQTELTSLYQTLPESGRRYYGAPERMLAALVNHEERPRWIHIRSIATPKEGVTAFEVDAQFWDDFDHLKPKQTFSFVHGAKGWQWAISGHSIKQYADFYRGVPFELAAPEAVPAIAWFFHSS
jgi:membrane-associated protease RseP (regulator of RpoE activity)